MASTTRAQKDEAVRNAEKKRLGKPRHFQTEEQFQKSFIDYLKFCQNQDPKRIPNIAGYCIYNDINKSVYYECETYYPNSFEKTRSALEDATINLKDTIRSIFLTKVWFGYRDSDPPVSAITLNYNNISDAQLDTWTKLAGLIDAPKNTVDSE